MLLDSQPLSSLLWLSASAVYGWATVMCGVSLFSRSYADGYGWVFPIGAFFYAAGLTTLAQLFGALPHVADHSVHVSMFDHLLWTVGLALAYVRVVKGVFTNSIVKWGWIMCTVSCVSVSISWWMWGTNATTSGLETTAFLMACVCLFLASRYHKRRMRILSYPLLAETVALVLDASALLSSNSVLAIAASYVRVLGITWMTYWLVIDPPPVAPTFGKERRTTLRLVKK